MDKNSKKRKFEHLRSDTRHYNAFAEAEDEQLTKILFGGPKELLANLEDEDSQSDENEPEIQRDLKPAWTDEDDEKLKVGEALDAQGRSIPDGGINSRSNKYKDLLENKFKFITGTQKWSEIKTKNDELLTCGFIKKSQDNYLPGSVLSFKKMRDLNCETYNEGPFINSIQFLRNSNVALIAGQSGIASFCVVDGKKNSKLHSIQFEKFQIFTSAILEDNEVIFGSRHPHIFSYDINSGKSTKIKLPPNVTTFKKCAVSNDQKIVAVLGKWGEIHLFTSKSKERIGVLKQTDEATALTFSPNDKSLYVHSESGEITIFDVNTRRVSHKFKDEGCLQGTTISISQSNQFFAAGSAQGIVNLYDVENLSKSNNPKPRKTITNLTTSITSLEFNPTSEILGFSSVDLPNSVKLYHVNSSSVFKNFPTFQTKFGNVNVLNFSPNSGYVAFGNKNSIVSLYRLSHYKNY